MGERRDYQRLAAEGRIVCFSESGRGEEAGGRLRNVSSRGLGILLPCALEPDTVVGFEFTAQAAPAVVRGTGRVCYVAPSGPTGEFLAGIEFTAINKNEIVYLLNRIQLGTADRLRRQAGTGPVDFIPY